MTGADDDDKQEAFRQAERFGHVRDAHQRELRGARHAAVSLGRRGDARHPHIPSPKHSLTNNARVRWVEAPG